MKSYLLVLLLLFPIFQLTAQDMLREEASLLPTPASGRLEVIYIANSGFMFSSGTTHLLIDALYLDAEVWETPSKQIQKDMMKGAPPFKNISHMLVSHYHADHFDATLVSRFLVNNPKAMLLTNHQTDSVLQKIYKTDQQLNRPNQIKVINTPMFSSGNYESGQLKVTTLGQRHMGKEDSTVESLGFLVELGGKKILHIGDADYTDENFAGFNLENEHIDIAFIHYWFLLDCEGRRIVETYIKPDKIVLTHVPYDELRRNYKRIKEYYPNVEVFLNHMDKKIF